VEVLSSFQRVQDIRASVSPPFFDVTAFSLPLTIKEIEEEPRIDYYGPNLTMLDMSELTLTLL